MRCARRDPATWMPAGRVWPEAGAVPAERVARVVAGPHVDHFAPGALDDLVAGAWRWRPRATAWACACVGRGCGTPRPGRPRIVSQGAVWGALQVPPDGQPIALLADHQTIGGYPILAVTIRADFPLLGQVAPGERLRFALCSVEEAQAAYRARQAALRAAAAHVAAPDLWERVLAAAEWGGHGSGPPP